MTKFTSSVGKGMRRVTRKTPGILTHYILGLSAATFDSEYQARRRMAQRRNKPRHAMCVHHIIHRFLSWSFSPNRYGVTAGGEALASSMASAFEGVVVRRKDLILMHFLIMSSVVR